MSEWPKLFHPAVPDFAGDGLAVDHTVTVEGYQLQPGTWDGLAAWCSGRRVLDDDGNQAIAVNGSLAADDEVRLGDFAMRVGGGYEVSRADGHYQRWQLATDDAPTPAATVEA